MNEEIINAIKKDIGPLKIEISADLVDHVYYLNVDGSKTYSDKQHWEENWGNKFSKVIALFLKHHLHKTIEDQDIEQITDTKIRVRLGTVFDFVKDTA